MAENVIQEKNYALALEVAQTTFTLQTEKKSLYS